MKYSAESNHKAVRDKIPEILRSSGKSCAVKELSNPDFLVELENKLEEELAEYLENKEVEELADIHPTNEFLASISRRKTTVTHDNDNGPDIYTMPYAEAMRHYHLKVLEKAGGNVEKAADRISVNVDTFRSRLRKYDIRKHDY